MEAKSQTSIAHCGRGSRKVDKLAHTEYDPDNIAVCIDTIVYRALGIGRKRFGRNKRRGFISAGVKIARVGARR